MKWGEVPRADLEMTAFPADTNATAVILCDYGEVSFSGSEFELNLFHHQRIKILTEAGYKKGEISITFYAKESWQRVNDLEAQTIFLAKDGSVRREKLDKKSIFNEDVDGSVRRWRFTFPALARGCVIEYRYKMISRGGTFLHDWDFQTDEPTRYSEFRAEIPNVLQYVMIRPLFFDFAIDAKEERVVPGVMFGTSHTLPLTSHRWAMRDVPALRQEPYMTAIDDYRARIRFQLSKIVWPGEMPVTIMNTWEKVAEDLMLSESFGLQIGSHGALRKQAETLVAGITEPEQKMRAIYDYLRATMVWDETRGIYASDLGKAFQARRGGGPEIALMLTSMLRAAGLDAHPLLISTRDHGKPAPLYSALAQFNHAMTYVKIGAREHLLDATDPVRPDNLLPVPALNGMGWVVDKKNPRWVNINTTGTFVRLTSVIAKLAADGSIQGYFEASESGYGGLLGRITLRGKKKDEEYVRDGWLKELAGAKLDSFRISNRDSSIAPLTTKAHFSTTENVQVAGDNMYFNPIFFDREDKNELTQPERNFPVDFAYSLKFVYMLNLTLPEGCTVLELPKSSTLNLPRDFGQFRRLATVEGNKLQLTSQITIRKPRFEPHEYKMLREFFDRVVAAHAEQVVLKRGTSAVVKEGVK